MRVRNRRMLQRQFDSALSEYNLKLKRRRTVVQRITRIVLTLCVLSFLSEVFLEVVYLTGLNSRSGVVSAHEPTREFNPVKKEKKVMVIIIADESDVKALLEKLGGEYVRKITE